MKERASRCRACSLFSSTSVVPGLGSKNPKVMILGEAPGQEEEIQGKPFVGPAGKVLQSIVLELGVTIQDLYITNSVKHRPPNNRDPTREERNACAELFLVEEIALIKPKVILCVGKIPARTMADLSHIPLPEKGLRGLSFQYKDIPVLVSWHPAYILRNQYKRPELLADFKTALELANSIS